MRKLSRSVSHEHDSPAAGPPETGAVERNGRRCPSAVGHDEAGAWRSTGEAPDPQDAWRLACAALDIALLVSGAPRGALFACGEQGLRLLALQGVRQSHLDAAYAAWARPDSELWRGQPHAPRRAPFVVLPCVNEMLIGGLVLLAWDSETLPVTTALQPLARVLGTLLPRLETGSSGVPRAGRRAEECPAAAAEVIGTQGFALYALLDEHEWNVARVARALGVTRMTVYNRMRTARIRRHRTAKARRGWPATVADRAVSAPPEAMDTAGCRQ